MTTENVKKGVLAIGLSPELDAFVKRAAEKAGCAAAHMGRVATIEAAARILGEPAPEVLESKKGPKAGGKLTPLAEKFALSNAELARRVSA